jgi:hypothetical protein
MYQSVKSKWHPNTNPDLYTEGIFRKNGNIRLMKESIEKINQDPIHVDLHDDNAVQIAALMRKFLRDMPEPLLVPSLQELFLCVASTFI